jgi:HEAT repeat protein
VRLKAIQGLKPYATRADVQAAFMHSLENDADAGIRVEAVEALTRNGGHNTSLAKALEPFTRDENSYVRMKVLQFVGNNR